MRSGRTRTVKSPADDVVERYLDRLDQALEGVPVARRDALLQETIERVVEARAELPDRHDESAVRRMLHRLGSPAAIAAAAGAGAGVVVAPGPSPGPSPGAVLGPDGREKLTILLLLFGGFAGGIGWLAGVALLWRSPRWGDRDKLIGTLVLPGGLLAAFAVALFLLGATASDLLPWLLIGAGVALAPLASAAHLWSRLEAPRPAPR